MIEVIECKMLELQKEEKISMDNQTRRNIKGIGKRVNIVSEISADCLVLSRLI